MQLMSKFSMIKQAILLLLELALPTAVDMVYQLRDRKKRKGIYIIDSSPSTSSSSSSSWSGSESEPNIRADPDFYSSSAARSISNSRPSTRARRERKRPRTGQNHHAGPTSDEDTARRHPGSPRKCTPASDQNEQSSQRERKRRSRKPGVQRTEFGDRLTVLALLIHWKVVNENERVHFWDNVAKKQGLEGRVTRRGILCKCCDQVMTVRDFVRHAGGGTQENESNSDDEYTSVVVGERRYPLLGCQLLAWINIFVANKWKCSSEYNANSASDTSDDACLVCADGGDLLCCDHCPLTYHPKCVGLQDVPEDVWVCPGCLCRVCGRPGSERKKISQCGLCEKAYHLGCGRPGFCGDSCAKLDMKLKSLVGKKTKLGDGLSWTLIRHTPNISEKEEGSSKLHEKVLGNSKIALAWMLMDESFMSIVDRLTRADLLRTVLYNNSSKFRRIDFKGFNTVILEKGDEMVAAASLRLRGKELAEMPYIATSWSYRNRGMLKKLMTGIESALNYLGVENLVLPSAEDVEDMWINKFGFELVEGGPMEKCISSSQMLMFPKSIKLVKSFVSKNKKARDENVRQGGFVESKSKTLVPFDLNFEPPSEDEDDAMGCG